MFYMIWNETEKGYHKEYGNSKEELEEYAGELGIPEGEFHIYEEEMDIES